MIAVHSTRQHTWLVHEALQPGQSRAAGLLKLFNQELFEPSQAPSALALE